MNSPKEIAIAYSDAGAYKANLKFYKFALMAVLGGMYIAFGGLFAAFVVGGMPEVLATNPSIARLAGAAVFPIGLILVTIAGGDLFTSDCAGMGLAYLDKKINLITVFKIWGISFFFNFIGTQIIAYFLSANVGVFDIDPWRSYLHKMASARINVDFYTIFIKGIGANWLVCLGAWMGYAGKDVVSKSLGIWLPVMLFVALGYEHSIANMFNIPAAIYSGADILWSDFIITNLIPATLGNIVGGVLFVACFYWFIYVKE